MHGEFEVAWEELPNGRGDTLMGPESVEKDERIEIHSLHYWTSRDLCAK